MQLEAFALRGQERRVALRSMLPLVDEQSARAWVQLAYEGEWEGHHSGAFAFTRDTFAAIVANFDRQANAIPLTYEHPAYAGDGKPVPAAGWVHELRMRDGKPAELWGLVEFTPPAAQFVRDGAYKFVSVVVGFESTDRRTGDDVGPELFEVGLTNVPFLDGMQPIRLSRRGRAFANGGRPMSDVDLIKAALKELGDDATLAQIMEWADAKKKLEAISSGEDPGAADAPADAPPAAAASQQPEETVSASQEPAETVAASDPAEPVVDAADPAQAAAGADLGALVASIAQVAGLDEAGLLALMQEHLDEVAAYFASLGQEQPDGTAAEAPAAMSRKLSLAENTVAILRREVDTLKASQAAREKADADAAEKAAQAEAEGAVDELIKAAKALDTERDNLVWLYRQDRKRFTELTASRGQIAPTTPQVVSKPPTSTPAEDALRKSADYRTYERALKHVIRDPNARHLAIVERINTIAARA